MEPDCSGIKVEGWHDACLHPLGEHADGNDTSLAPDSVTGESCTTLSMAHTEKGQLFFWWAVDRVDSGSVQSSAGGAMPSGLYQCSLAASSSSRG